MSFICIHNFYCTILPSKLPQAPHILHIQCHQTRCGICFVLFYLRLISDNIYRWHTQHTLFAQTHDTRLPSRSDILLPAIFAFSKNQIKHRYNAIFGHPNAQRSVYENIYVYVCDFSIGCAHLKCIYTIGDRNQIYV